MKLQRIVAEKGGFEPPMGVNPCRISSAVQSTTLPLLRADAFAFGCWRGVIKQASGLGNLCGESFDQPFLRLVIGQFPAFCGLYIKGVDGA